MLCKHRDRSENRIILIKSGFLRWQIHSLSLSLGPDFMTDVVIVETSDHARLQIQLSYNWNFDVDRSDPEDAAKIFQVPDFVGDACKASQCLPSYHYSRIN